MSKILENNPRLSLSYFISKISSEVFVISKDNYEIIDPAFNLVSTYGDITNIMDTNDKGIMEYIYMNMKKIHKVLYEEDEEISLRLDLMENFVNYYYLYNLILDQKEIINYRLEDSRIIKKAYDSSINTSDIKKLIYSKIIIALIDNLNNDEQIMADCEEFKKKCIDNINSNKSELGKYAINIDLENLANDNDISVDEIYADIIKTLILTNQLNETTETLTLLNDLEIKNIRLNKVIFKALKEVLIKKYLEEYIIDTIDNLFEKKKIIFYYVLYQYILKNSDYTYQIPFLKEIRNNIIEIINNKLETFYEYLKKNRHGDTILHNKMKEVFNYFDIPYEYYRNKASKNKKNNDDNNIPQRNENNENKKDTENIQKSKNESIESGNSNNNIINRNSDPTSGSNNQSSRSNSNSSSDSGSKNPFDASSFKNKNDNDDFSEDSINPNIDDEQNEEAIKILQKSEFILKVRYDKKKGKTVVEIKVNYGNKKNEDIENIKNMNINDNELKNYYEKFLTFLDSVEKEIISTSSDNIDDEIILKLLISMEGRKFDTVQCKYEAVGKEVDPFISEKLLNKDYKDKLTTFINEIFH